MTWTNGPATLYHGTTGYCADAIQTNGEPDLAKSRAIVDFGRGFYMTSIRRQAVWHANNIFNLRRATANAGASSGVNHQCAAVIQYEIDRTKIGHLYQLCFVSPSKDWFDFVDHCRLIAPRSSGPAHNYDVVYGPLRAADGSAYPATDYEQVSFHSTNAIHMLSLVRVFKGRPNLP
jgi:hypothetical protein